jgi:hypothetical protein
MCYNHMSDLYGCLLEAIPVLFVFPALYRFTKASLFCYRYFFSVFSTNVIYAYRYTRHY